ncbi:hypothetical protein [Novosphingobium aquimarinum]|uniref:hypothetical protein n=1 Tax=Novosphingobium aquimarinum TaxID=2682494 RepID=UPI0012EB67E7|nr:hypothetical protein [Novosphingobium aquimarinum]
MIRQFFRVPLAALAALTMAIVPAQARDESDPKAPEALSELARCRAIAEPAARLACYDKEASALIAATEEGTVRVVDTEEVKTIRRSLFGFSLPSIGLFGGGREKGEQEEVKLINTTITDVRALPYGKYQFTIAEGDATWQTTDAPLALRKPKVGDEVELERAALGSYWVRFEGQRAVKGKRVQ